ncbi:MAG: hypothetical protein WCZ20_01785 [Hydrogenophaga sp.]
MGEQIAALVDFDDPTRRDAVAELLSEARPDFEDELPAWQVPLFRQLEDVDYADACKPLGERALFLHWWCSEDTLAELDRKLQACGGTIRKAQVFVEEPLAEDYLDGMYYARRGKCLEMVDPKEHGLKMPGDYPEREDWPAQLAALMQEF